MRGNRYGYGYPEAVRRRALALWSNRRLTTQEIGQRALAAWPRGAGVRPPPGQGIPKATLRGWALAAGLPPRPPGRRRKEAA